MRLQLIVIIGLSFIYTGLPAQTNIDHHPETSIKQEQNSGTTAGVDVDFLFGYYNQDGDHSAVTGGVGTEKLTDRDFRFIVNVALDSIQMLNVNTAINYYSSASTDNIDTKVSSASSHDVRSQFNFTYTRLKPKNRSSFSIGWGGAVESDYISTSLNAFWNKISKDANSQISIGTQLFFDNWVLIIPEELRTAGTELPGTNKRRSYSFSVNYQKVLSTRIQAELSGELVYQSGLLSTPFHRVYFIDQDTAKIEKLPDNRFKMPISIRLNYFLADYLVLRSFIRYYQDNFGIDAITTSIEPRIKPGTFFTFYPFYRYTYQSAAEYFAPYKQHSLSEDYYTSDYDLSQFDSHSFGVGLHWSPLYGIGRFHFLSRKRISIFKSIDIRYTHYIRSDGLSADLIGFDFGFGMVR